MAGAVLSWLQPSAACPRDNIRGFQRASVLALGGGGQRLDRTAGVFALRFAPEQLEVAALAAAALGAE